MLNLVIGARGSLGRDPAAGDSVGTARAPCIRFFVAALIVPVATTFLIEAAFVASIGATPSGEELSVAIWLGLITGFFVEFLIFLPLYVVARRCFRMSLRLSTAVGALSGWVAPLAYLLLMALWRGGTLDAWVINFSDHALSPWLAVLGALGAAIFWLIVRKAETASPLARPDQRATSIARPAPVNGFSGS